MADGRPVLSGIRVLVVEDEFLLAVDIAEALAESGASVVGPVRRITPPEAAASRADCAVVDVDTPHGDVWMQVSALLLSGTPTIVLTGGVHDVPDPRFASVPVLRKPVDPRLLASTLSALVPTAPADEDAGLLPP